MNNLYFKHKVARQFGVAGTVAMLLLVSAASQAATIARATTTTTMSVPKSATKAAPATKVSAVNLSRKTASPTTTKQDLASAQISRNACAHGYCESLTLDKAEVGYTLKPYNVGDYKWQISTIKKYLTLGGNLTPKNEPEYGESGYYDTYYGKVDPLGERATFAGWKTVNGFENGWSPTRARYINAYDLGFGRDMNCKSNACYVTNYSDPKGINGAPVKEVTVAMERRYRSSKTYVAFYVYDKFGQRINAVALDSEGAKSVPESCFACHKGYISPGGTPYGGSFLPFDVNLLETWPGGGRPTKYAQMEEFRRLNYMVWSDTNANAGGARRNEDIASLIEEWYDGAPYTGTTYSDYGHAPTSWYSQVNGAGVPVNGSDVAQDCAANPMPQACKKYFYEGALYKNVYIKYCRSCHIAQGPVQDTSPGSWGTVFKKAVSFSSSGKLYACNGDKSMPHAELTDERFRTDVINYSNGSSGTPEDFFCNTTSP